MVFLCDLSFLWWVLANKRLPVGYHQSFNLCSSTLVVSVSKILFSFSEIIRNFSPTDIFMCSFDVCSLYANVPLEETIGLCFDVLFRSSPPKPTFPESVFKHLINFATSSVEFSFNNIMYRQIDGVAMGSSLGPTLANIFVGFCECNLFNKIDRPHVLSLR